MTRRRLAVLGSPIAHSLSPVLHGTAYDLLGLPFDYEAVEVPGGGLAAFVAGLDPSWRGLSLTMPLKREVLPLADELSPLARRLGVANTLVLGDDGRRTGHNTDVDGIVRAVRAVRPRTATGAPEARVGPGGTGPAPEGAGPGDEAPDATILGGGATAASALAAVVELGARRVDVHVRDAARAADLLPLADDLGVALRIAPLAGVDPHLPRPLVVSTLPGGAADDVVVTPATADAVLLDAAYDPWPSALASRWGDAGGTVRSGLDMLVEQAVGQVRLFSGRDQHVALPDEDAVRAALRRSVGLGAV